MDALRVRCCSQLRYSSCISPEFHRGLVSTPLVWNGKPVHTVNGDGVETIVSQTMGTDHAAPTLE